MSEELIQTTTHNGVASIVLNRPEALNALNTPLLRQLNAALSDAMSDKECRCVVLEGMGRGFSAGVDLKMLLQAEISHGRVTADLDDAGKTAMAIIRQSQKPVIAKVHGFCFTGALELALHADFIFTTENTKFGDTHATFGVRPSGGMSQNLARALGVRRARELSFTGSTFSGLEAAAWGLANAAYASKEELDEQVEKRAAAISACSPGVVAAYKDLYRLHEELQPLETALEKELERDYPEINDTKERLGKFMNAT